MDRHTKVVLLLILATAAASFADVVLPQSEGDFDLIVRELEVKQNQLTRCFNCCPFGWVKFEGRCYTYKATRKDWASAENYCLTLDAHLVSIHNENEHQLVKALIRAHDPESHTWIGLSSCEKQNRFFWSDGSKLTYTNWNPGQPDFYPRECCGHITSTSTKNWNDIPCDNSYPFVCARSF